MFDFKNSPCTCGYTGHSDSGMLHLCAQSPPTYPTIYTQKDSCAHAHTHTHLDVIYSDTFTVCTCTHMGMHRHPWRLPPPTHTPPSGMF